MKIEDINIVSKFIVIVIATSFVFIGFAGGSQINEENPVQISNKLDTNLQDVAGTIDVRINLQSDIDIRATANQIESFGVKINRINTVSVNYFETTLDAELLDSISAIDEVTWMQQIYEPQTLMDQIQSNTFMGADTPQSNSFTGSGILAEVIDNGCDLDHPDMGQVQYTDFAPVSDDHGTCTTGIMFGDGTGNAAAEGIMYEATGVFGDWGNGNALGISNLWQGTFASGNAGQNGVVQTNSWWNGATMDGEYDAMSNEIDQAIVDNPKVLTHWAIGNSNDGEAEGLMSAESISKNNMAVGAIFHMDTASTADDDWHSAGAGMTPSRGPAADGRAKPDMLACFDWILCADEDVGGFGYVAGAYYDDFGGTSGATPTVAGCSGLAYEMYQENYFDNNPAGDWPYSSTIKALMIADAFQYDMTAGNEITRNVQGWGSPDMENMYNLADQYHVIEEYPQALSGGDSWSRGVFSDGINPLKITLAWIDPAAPDTTIAGRALINNLDLHVTSPTGTEYWGNNGLGTALYSSSGTGAQRWSSTASYRDDLNNVENVFIQSPEVGVWTVEVQGRSGDLPQGPQDFSVVASGAAGISSMGTIDLDRSVYLLEDTATITVADLDLDTDSGTIQIVNANVDSDTEPAGETVVLTETAVDSATFEGTLTLSETNGAGILQVSHDDTITATYNDADDGSGSPAVATDTATVDGSPPDPPTALTVEWWGQSLQDFWGEGFEGDGTPTFAELGWTTGGASTDWEIGTPSGLGGEHGNPDPVGAAGGSTFCIGNDLTGLGTYPGDYETSLAADSNYIYSPPIDCSMASSMMVYFERYLNVESPSFDHANIEISTDELVWNQVWTNSAEIADTAWAPQSYDISAWADNEPTVYIRFEIGSTDGSFQYCGWNIDEIYVEGLVVGGTDDNCLNWTLSADDGAGDDDVSQYNIYRANSDAGPWDAGAYIASVPAGSDQYVDLGRGEFDGTNWWYVIRAEDAVGNEELNTAAIPEVPVTNMPPSVPNIPDPANGAIGVGLNPTLSARVSDPNTNPMDVSFYDASGPTLIGTDTNVPSGSFASVDWTGLSADTPYDWYVIADDGVFTTQSPTWSFTTIDTTPPAAPTGLTVDWWGIISQTWIDEDFSGGVPPAGWDIYSSGTTGTWSQQSTSNAGGTSPEARFYYGSNGLGTSILYAGPFDTTGLTTMDLQWQNMIDDYTSGDGVVLKVQTSDDASSWTDAGWEWDDTVTPGDEPASLKTLTVDTADVGSSTFYIGWAVEGNSYQLMYWYIDDVLLTSSGGSTTDDNWLNWTLSGDDGAGVNDVDHYNIYRSNVQTGPWDGAHLIDAVPAGTDTYMDYGMGESDGTIWWYVVRAVDIWTNEEMNTIAVPEPGATLFPFDIDMTSYSAGDWALISFPIAVSGNIEDILNDATLSDGLTTWDVAKWYDPAIPSDPWKTYRFGVSTNDLITIDNEMGVWIHLTNNGGDQRLTTGVTGDYSGAAVDISLTTGWNLVSYPSITDRLASTTLPGVADMVSYYDSGATYLITDALPNTVTFREGNAYWVHVTADTVWSVDP